MPVRLYLASPLGFSEAGREFSRGRLIPLVERLGYGVIDPWSFTAEAELDAVRAMPAGEQRAAAWQRLNREIGARNRRALDAADGVVAVLDGADVDSGTAAEVGYAFARGKRIVGYRGDFRVGGENETAVVNLQVEYFIEASGGVIVTGVERLPEALRRFFG